ncbi:MAG: CSLREA domain-containing protein [Anaerolineae bacterium]|nr:CSLREA domain-containing protein [Anaerolineae bacterium]
MNNFPAKRLIGLCMVALAITLLWSATPPRAQAATITVDTAVDELDGSPGNGSCSLREAIQNANQDNANQVDCNSGSGADIIIFDSSLDGVPITLSRTGANEDLNVTGDLDIRSPITINGNGANRTIIDADGIDRIFDLPTGQSLTLNGVTVQNGDAPVPVGTAAHGGGIRNLGGSLTINAAHITANTQSDSDGTTGGGGIFNSGTLTVTNSTISDNYSIGGGGGGGIANVTGFGMATLTNSTISGNRSNANGGGILNSGSASLTLTNVTITANIANDDNTGPGGGGGLRHNGNSTFTTAGNNIIVGNMARLSPTQDDCSVSGNPVTTNGYNLRPSTTGCAGALNAVTDITVVTVGLGPLQDNGGPTPTHNLLAGSDAIDRIPPTVNGCVTTVTADQRGVTRADGIATGTLCDVGAVEYIAPIAPGATTGGDGPGGVGVADGSSSLELWLRGDRGVFADAGCSSMATGGGAAGCWQDQSGNGYDPTEATNFPSYETAVVNGQAVLRFGGAHHLQRPFEAALNPANFTLFGVWNSTGASCPMATCSPLTSRISPDEGYSLFNAANTWQFGVYDGTANVVGTAVVVTDTWELITAAHDGTQSLQYVGSGLDDQAVTGYTPLSGTVSLRVGAGESGGGALDNFFWGDIAEEIIFSTALTDVQRILVENYLSAKYDIDITASGHDHYDGDTPGNGNFDLDVAGIGQFGGNRHTQAHSVGMIVRDRSFLQDDGDWLLFGHRHITNTNTTADLPTTGDWDGAPDPRRWERHWFIDVTDAVTPTLGMVDIIFDFGEGSMAGILPDGPVNNYRLLQRTADTGDFTDMATATAVIGDQVHFLGVNVADLGSNFTLATLDFANSPTAVTMQTITAVSNSALPMVVMGMMLLLAVASLGLVIRKR